MKYLLKNAVVLVRPTATWIGSGRNFAIRLKRYEECRKLIEAKGFDFALRYDKSGKVINRKQTFEVETFLDLDKSSAARLLVLDDLQIEASKNLPSPLKEMADADLVEVIVVPDALKFDRV